MVLAERLSVGCCHTWTLDGRYNIWTLPPVQMKGLGGWRAKPRARGAIASSLGQAKRSPRSQAASEIGPEGTEASAAPLFRPFRTDMRGGVPPWGCASLAPGYSLWRFQRLIRLRLSRGSCTSCVAHAPLTHNHLRQKPV